MDAYPCAKCDEYATVDTMCHECPKWECGKCYECCEEDREEPEIDERWEQTLREHAEDQNPSLEDFYDMGY